MKTIGEFLFPEIAEKYGKTARRAVCAAALVLSVLLFCAAATADPSEGRCLRFGDASRKPANRGTAQPSVYMIYRGFALFAIIRRKFLPISLQNAIIMIL